MPASILIVDDEAGIRESLGALLRDEGYDVAAGDSGGAQVRTGAAGRLAEKAGWAGYVGEDAGARRRADGGDDFGARKYRDGGARDQAGRVRFHRKATVVGENRSGGAERAGILATGYGKSAAEGRTAGAHADSGRQRTDEGAAAADCFDGADEWSGADLRRKRHGQGIGGAGVACEQLAGRKTIRGSELRGDSGRADRIGNVRAPQGELYRGERRQDRQIPESGRRDVVSG